jgi:hypothetical protein
MNAHRRSPARLLLSAALALAPLAAGAEHVDDVDHATGLPLAQWTAGWWQRVLSMPLDAHPLRDPSGARCMVGQHGAVWFLDGTAGGSGERHCTVPPDVPVLVPVMNRLVVGTVADDVDALRADAASCVEAVHRMHVELDGRPLPKRAGPVRVRSVAFHAMVPDDGWLARGLRGPLVDDGWYLALPPLRPGRHVLRLEVAAAGCDGVPPRSIEVDYRLDVAQPCCERRRIPTPRRAPRARGPRASRRSRARPSGARSPRR